MAKKTIPTSPSQLVLELIKNDQLEDLQVMLSNHPYKGDVKRSLEKSVLHAALAKSNPNFFAVVFRHVKLDRITQQDQQVAQQVLHNASQDLGALSNQEWVKALTKKRWIAPNAVHQVTNQLMYRKCEPYVWPIVQHMSRAYPEILKHHEHQYHRFYSLVENGHHDWVDAMGKDIPFDQFLPMLLKEIPAASFNKLDLYLQNSAALDPSVVYEHTKAQKFKKLRSMPYVKSVWEKHAILEAVGSSDVASAEAPKRRVPKI